MRWLVFAIFGVVGLVLDISLLDALAPDEARLIRPSVCAALAVFLALSAPKRTALWGCFILGLLLDLSSPLMLGGDRILHLVGPYALGYVAGAALVLRGRTLVFRRRPLTIGVMTFVALLAVHAVVIVLHGVRSWYPGGPVCWTDTTLWAEILQRFLIALYSGLFAIPVGWLLVWSMPLWGFPTTGHRRAAW